MQRTLQLPQSTTYAQRAIAHRARGEEMPCRLAREKKSRPHPRSSQHRQERRRSTSSSPRATHLLAGLAVAQTLAFDATQGSLPLPQAPAAVISLTTWVDELIAGVLEPDWPDPTEDGASP